MNGQQPYIANARQPSTYRNPVNGQQPYIANARQPATYARQGRTPFTYQNRQPSTYARQGRTPVIRWDGNLSQQWPAADIS